MADKSKNEKARMLAEKFQAARNHDQEDPGMEVKSSVFQDGGKIPRKYTCHGEDLSPPLTIESVPGGTHSLALIVYDSDAPGGDFDHWVVWDLPPNLTEIPEGAGRSGAMEIYGASEGKNSFGEAGYRGPCPSSGGHRYRFHVVALKDKVDVPAGADRGALERAMEGKVLERASSTGLYT